MIATDTQNLKLTTGRLYWQPTGENGFIDFGNCTSHKLMPDVQRVEHWKSDNGMKRCDHSRLKSLKPVRVFTFDEHFGEWQRLPWLSSAATEVTQGSATGSAFVISSAALVLGRSYDIGKQSVTITAAQNGGAVALVANVDYVIDRGAGVLTIISSAKFGSDWTFTFNCAAVTRLNFEIFSRLLEEGSFVFIEKDQLDSVPGSREAITGQVYVTGWGENNAEQFQEYTVEVLEI